MKNRKINIAVALIMGFVMFFSNTAQVEAAPERSNVLVCAEYHPDPCDFLTKDDVQALFQYAVSSDKDVLRAYTVRWKVNEPWKTIYQTQIVPSLGQNEPSKDYGVADQLFPEHIRIKKDDCVGIPQIGVNYCRGFFTIYHSTFVGQTVERVYPHGLYFDTTLNTYNPEIMPAEYVLEDTAQSAMMTYVKIRHDLHLDYTWSLTENGDYYFINIYAVYVQAYVENNQSGYSNHALPPTQTVNGADNLQPAAFAEGTYVEVTEVFTEASMYRVNDAYFALYDVLTYYTVKLPNGVEITLDAYDAPIYYPRSCKGLGMYFPAVGDKIQYKLVNSRVFWMYNDGIKGYNCQQN